MAAVTVDDLGALLPHALSGTAAAAFGDRIFVLGGNGPAGFNATVYAFSPSGTGGVVTAIGSLPQPLHDAGAVADAAGVLLCGGGRSVGETTIYRIVPGGTADQAGSLPRPLSDLAGVLVDGRPYCLGGWTGTTYSDAVYDLSGLGAQAGSLPVAAHLPHAVRYGAAVPLKGGLLVAGGRTSAGATADLQWIPLGPGAGTPRVVGKLPQPLAYTMGATLDGTGLVIGGCDAAGATTAAILAVTPAGGAVDVGRLPAGVCYGSAATLGGSVYVFGGQTAGGATTDHVWRITARPVAP